MAAQQVDEKAVFNTARRIADPAVREEFLRQACGDDKLVIERLRELLRIHDQEQSFLESPAVDLRPTANPSAVTEQPGTFIGPYKLLQQIGEGGMGVVFMAQQTEPIQRTVALKIIKPGMDSTQVVARFEAERQALALMDHPNVAKVLDAGMTATGRPYFVMDLVKGVPITQFCDDRQLSLRARLELLLPVCQAVQHAHQKGIIHRDIKPTNVLVAEYDQHAVPKVIDFGIAKATAQKLTERTMFTQFGQLLGTFEYMSPEQAKLNQLDVDTRSDIYSLGVLLYEILTGSTPFAQQRFREAAFDEVLRIIREEEPPKPSTKLSSSNRLPSIAANRHTEPARLTKAVRGELDWIVMKALDKERDRRYQTAAGLAEDIGRYLTDQPVAARRPTRVYRLRKFARRNKLAILAGTVMVAAISLGLTATLYFAASASREAKHATAALAQAEFNGRTAQGINTFFTEEVFGLADPNRSNRAGITLLEALDSAAGKIDAKFPNDPVLRAEVLDRLGEIYIAIDKPNKAVPQLQHAVDLRKSFAGDKNPATLKSRSLLGWALHRAGRWEEARDILQSAMDEQAAALGQGNPDTLQTMNDFDVLLTELRGYGIDAASIDRDLEIAQNAYDEGLRKFGPKHFATLRAETTLGLVLRWRNRLAEALPHARAAALGLTEVAGNENPETMFAHYDYALCLYRLQRYDEAVTELKPLVAVRNRVLGPLHYDSLWASGALADALKASGNSAESLAVLEDVYAHLQQSPELPNWRRVRPILSIGNAYLAVGRDDRAAELFSLVEHVLSSVSIDEAAPAARAGCSNELAVQLIASTSPKIRNFDRAIRLATQACELTNFRKPNFIRVLVVAYLEKGDVARSTRPQEAEADYRRGMELYDAHAAVFTADPGSDYTVDHARFVYFLSAIDRQVEAAEALRRGAANAKRITNPNTYVNALYFVALAQQFVGDHAGYRDTCKTLIDMPQDKLEARAKARPVWAACLGPDALDDSTLPVKLADELVQNNSLNEPHYGLYLLGAAHYRSGQYELAAKRLTESIDAYPSSTPSESDSINYHRLFLAMTKWQLGQHGEARRLLAETLPAIEKELDSSSSGWNRRATLELLRRQAEALIESKEIGRPKNDDKSDSRAAGR